MPSVKDLVRKTARQLAMPDRDVNIHARQLLDQYLLPVSRGRSIAQVDESHVALLLIAILATDRRNEAARAAQLYRHMPVKGDASDTAPTFHDIMRNILEGRHDAIAKQIQNGEIIVNRRWPEARIVWTDGTVAEFAPRDAEPGQGLRVEARLSGARLHQLALSVWQPPATWTAEQSGGTTEDNTT